MSVTSNSAPLFAHSRTRIVHAASCEAGYWDTEIIEEGDMGYVIGRDFPLELLWMAATLAPPRDECTKHPGGCGTRFGCCWTCFSTKDDDIILDCTHGLCSHPEGPARPPRGLLGWRRDR